MKQALTFNAENSKLKYTLFLSPFQKFSFYLGSFEMRTSSFDHTLRYGHATAACQTDRQTGGDLLISKGNTLAV
jgi:hypothetical protein